MGTWTRAEVDLDCGEDCGYGGCRKQHEVAVSFHRSTDMTTLMVNGNEIVMTDRLATVLFDLWRAMREEAA